MITPTATVNDALSNYLSDITTGAHGAAPKATPSASKAAAKSAKATTVTAAAAGIKLDKVGPTKRPNGVAYFPRLLGGHEDLAVLRRLREATMFPLLSGPPGAGKCMPADTLVFDPSTGSRVPLIDLIEAGESGVDVEVLALGLDGKLRPAKVSHFIRNGVRDVFQVKLRSGRRVRATGNHPLLTVTGWQEISALTAGDRVAVPRVLSYQAAGTALTLDEVILLAALVGDGVLGGPGVRYAFGDSEALVVEVERAALAFGCRTVRRPAWNYMDIFGSVKVASRKGQSRKGTNPALTLVKQNGLYGKTAAHKFVPDAIMTAPLDTVALFLNRMWGTDGHASPRTTGGSVIGYSTISRQLVQDTQHLLSRFGILSKIRFLKRDVYVGTDKAAWQVDVTDQASLRVFAEKIGIFGKEAALANVIARLDVLGVSNTNTDTIPAQAWVQIAAAKMERPWADVAEGLGLKRGADLHVGKRGLSRSRLLGLAETLDDDGLRNLATSDVFWDEVVSVESVGRMETYDITVPGDHNFVADDVIVHNTAMVEAAFGADLTTIVCSGDSEVADFVGQWVQTGDTFEWVDGPLVRCMLEGKVLLVDELALCPPSVLSVLYPAMDGRGEITIATNPKRGIIKAAKGFGVCGAYNPGVPGAKLSEAMASRFTLSFTVRTDWTLAKALKVPAEAVKVARNLEQKVGEVEWVPQLRELLAFRDLANVLGVDAAWANLVAIAPEYDRDVVKSVVAAVRGTAVEALALGEQI